MFADKIDAFANLQDAQFLKYYKTMYKLCLKNTVDEKEILSTFVPYIFLRALYPSSCILKLTK